MEAPFSLTGRAVSVTSTPWTMEGRAGISHKVWVVPDEPDSRGQHVPEGVKISDELSGLVRSGFEFGRTITLRGRLFARQSRMDPVADSATWADAKASR